MTDYALARANMVESQLRPNRVSDAAVLDAFRTVPREAFLPQAARAGAYLDEDVPVGGGRYLIEPVVLARLVQAAAIGPDESVLVVGCPGGYAAAILVHLAGRVVALEADAAVAARLRDALAGEAKATVVEGGLESGAAPGPFDVVLIAGAVPHVPPALFDLLRDGGRLLGVVGPARGGFGEAVIVERIGRAQSRRALFDAATPALPGFEPAPAFAF